MESEDDPELSAALRDTLESTLVISSTAGLQYLSDTMKNALSEGLNTLKANICMKAFEYFKLHDFEPTPDVVPIMRSVVQVALEKGAL